MHTNDNIQKDNKQCTHAHIHQMLRRQVGMGNASGIVAFLTEPGTCMLIFTTQMQKHEMHRQIPDGHVRLTHAP